MRLGDGADLSLNALFLLQEHAAAFEIAKAGQHGALHDGATLVIFDIAHPDRLLERDLLCKTLLLEIANSIIVGIGQKVHHGTSGFDIVFEMGHKVCTVALDLLVRRDGTEDDFSELAVPKRPEGDATHDLQRVLDDRY